MCENEALDLLEELLSITENLKSKMGPAQREAWQRISARCADLRDGTDED